MIKLDQLINQQNKKIILSTPIIKLPKVSNLRGFKVGNNNHNKNFQ